MASTKRKDLSTRTLTGVRRSGLRRSINSHSLVEALPTFSFCNKHAFYGMDVQKVSITHPVQESKIEAHHKRLRPKMNPFGGGSEQLVVERLNPEGVSILRSNAYHYYLHPKDCTQSSYYSHERMTQHNGRCSFTEVPFHTPQWQEGHPATCEQRSS